MENIHDITFIHLGNNYIIDMVYEQDLRDISILKKPNGFWASKFAPNNKHKSSWHEFIHFNKNLKSTTKEVLFKIKENTPILILDDLTKLDSKYINLDILKDTLNEVEELEKKLMNKSPQDNDFFLLLEKYYKLSNSLNKNLINWSNILNDFRGVYLTENALYSRFFPAFNTWDVESLVIFDTCILETVTNR